ncbi:MAG: GNAT family N-acetyltransferase [Sulfobacillus acidophilus]|uniref:GNAT family N-acetyltransferase n=1 Tax=Sulfobacillus acidophilus TaxID=53633 RepID=A0A2T2WJY8_9FIRM|nr:MAG: GNAT family N-acetyltransferase [Sulfobacillus acidophilus]
MIRNYQSGDEKAFIATWNEAMPTDGITEELFVNRILTDVNFDPKGLLIAEESGHIVGGLVAIVRTTPMSGLELEPDSGWITAFFIHPSARGNGLGRSLMLAAQDFFRSKGRRTIYFSSYAPNYFVPGIDQEQYPAGAALLQSVGFRTLYQCVAMDKNLVGFEIPEDVSTLEQARQEEGYVVETLSLPYIASVIDFNNREFDPDWTRAIRDALKGGVPLSNIFICRKDQEVVGFCMYGGYDNIAERFGPFGVAQSLRGTGLGKVLLYRCLEQMRRHGLHGAWFLWTGEKETAGHLYRRAGFRVTRRFDVMIKDLS